MTNKDNIVEFNKREDEQEEKCVALEMAEEYLDILLDAKDPDELLDILHNVIHTAMNIGRVSEVMEEIEAKEDYLHFLLSNDEHE